MMPGRGVSIFFVSKFFWRQNWQCDIPNVTLLNHNWFPSSEKLMMINTWTVHKVMRRVSTFRYYYNLVLWIFLIWSQFLNRGHIYCAVLCWTEKHIFISYFGGSVDNESKMGFSCTLTIERECANQMSLKRINDTMETMSILVGSDWNNTTPLTKSLSARSLVWPAINDLIEANVLRCIWLKVFQLQFN